MIHLFRSRCEEIPRSKPRPRLLPRRLVVDRDKAEAQLLEPACDSRADLFTCQSGDLICRNLDAGQLALMKTDPAIAQAQAVKVLLGRLDTAGALPADRHSGGQPARQARRG